MKNLIYKTFLIISCCFLVAIQVFFVHWIWDFSVTSAFISGWNARECRSGEVLPQGDLEDDTVATSVYTRHPSQG